MMDIYSGNGTKVRLTRPTSGYTHDVKQVAKHLIEGNTYTVDRTVVHQSSSNVYLIEIPNESFNTIHFDDLSIISFFDATNKEHISF